MFAPKITLLIHGERERGLLFAVRQIQKAAAVAAAVVAVAVVAGVGLN